MLPDFRVDILRSFMEGSVRLVFVHLVKFRSSPSVPFMNWFSPSASRLLHDGVVGGVIFACPQSSTVFDCLRVVFRFYV